MQGALNPGDEVILFDPAFGNNSIPTYRFISTYDRILRCKTYWSSNNSKEIKFKIGYS